MASRHSDIAAKVDLYRTTVNRILNRYPHHYLPREAIAKLWRTTRKLLLSLLDRTGTVGVRCVPLPVRIDQ